MKIERTETFVTLIVSVHDVATMIKAIDYTGLISKEDPDISGLRRELYDVYKHMTGKEYGTR